MIRKIATGLISVACTLALEALPARAQGPPCAPRASIVDTLGNRYQENLRAIGLTSRLTVLEIYVSDRGTWTALVSNPQGMSCVVAAGEAWQEIPLPVPHPEAGTKAMVAGR